MSNPRLIYETPEGGIVLVIPAPERLTGQETPEEMAARFGREGAPEGAIFGGVVEAEELPSRERRNEWARDQAGRVADPQGRRSAAPRGKPETPGNPNV